MKNLISLLTLGLFSGVSIMAQVGIGQWETHLTYSHGKTVSVAGTTVFCGTEESLYSYDYLTEVIEKYDKPLGYVGLGVTASGYCSTSDATIVAYDDANVDIIKKGEIVNLPQIKEFLITGDKNIYNITSAGDSAILSCGFGVVIIDTEKEIIKTDVKFSDDLSFAGAICYDAAILNGYYYFATSQGVYKVDYNSNIKNLSNWQLLTGLPSGHFNTIVNHNGTLYFNYSNYFTNALDNSDTLYTSDGSVHSVYNAGNVIVSRRINDLASNFNTLGILAPDIAWLVNNAGSITTTIAGCFTNSERIDIDIIGGAWIAYDGSGMMGYQGGCASYYVDGPYNKNVWDIDIVNSEIWVASGGLGITLANAFIADKMYYRTNNDWKWLNLPDFGYQYPATDIHCVAVDRADPGHAFGGSWGTGLYEMNGYNQTQVQHLYPDIDSTTTAGLPYRIGGFAWDDNGNLWFTNSHTSRLLRRRKPDGTFDSVVLSGTNNTYNATKVEVDTRDQVWVALPTKGVAVYKAGNGTRILNNAFNNGDLPDLNIRAIACDDDGQVWIGTHDGIRVFSASQIFNSTNINGQKIVIKDENGINELLLKETIINDIVVDGSNRKWIATQGTGVRLVSSDGREIIHSFTAENSPLLSNIVRCIAIDGNTGEVFFGTDRGIISFRSDATDGGDSFGDVYAFPNPVHPNYNGPIAIKGMANDATVKITDIAGNIVFETKSEGGQAVWDGRRYDGKRPATGVYLVFCSNEDASETVVTKILYIN